MYAISLMNGLPKKNTSSVLKSDDHPTVRLRNWPEKHSDRHLKNKIEGVNRSRGEAAETIHHLFMAKLKAYITEDAFYSYKNRYKECIRMLNGMEKSLEQHLPEHERRWPQNSRTPNPEP